MNGREEPVRPPNPFATRYIRPGAIPYRFPPGVGPEDLVDRLATNGWNGQIIGPHGSGKSTLLAALVEPLSRADRRVQQIGLHDGQRRLPRGWLQQAQTAGVNQLVIDGFEQLSWLARSSVRRFARRNRMGLLVTGHSDLGLPTLLTTQGDLETAVLIAEQLMAHSPWRLERPAVEAEFAATEGNVRETLFRLFDRWEAIARQAGGGE
jgi:molybdopterin-guanine dinucleotide biosynthesis protein